MTSTSEKSNKDEVYGAVFLGINSYLYNEAAAVNVCGKHLGCLFLRKKLGAETESVLFRMRAILCGGHTGRGAFVSLLRLARILSGDGQGNKKTSPKEQGRGRMVVHKRNLIRGCYASLIV
jgi:hypothetical protein